MSATATKEDQVTEPKAKKVTPDEVKAETKTPKKETVTKESEALGKLRTEFINGQRRGAQAYLKLVESEIEKVEPGHPHYSGLKFAKIRAERILFSLDELSKNSAS